MSEIQSLTIRFPRELYEQLRIDAATNSRSLNAEVIFRCANYISVHLPPLSCCGGRLVTMEGIGTWREHLTTCPGREE